MFEELWTRDVEASLGRDSIIGSTYCERLVLSTRLNQLVTT